jgi:hypothetical protein
MKLQDVHTRVDEAVLDLVQGPVDPNGNRTSRTYNKNVQAKMNFRNIFVKKMIGILQGQWPEVDKRQQELQQQAELVQQQMQAKVNNYQFNKNPAAAEAERYAAQTPAPGTVQAESYDFYNKMFKKAFFEAVAPAQPPQTVKLTMADYIVKVVMQYMQGVDLTQNMKQITDLAKMIEFTYKQNGGVPALRKLGDLLYDLAATRKAETQPPEEKEPESLEVQQILYKFQLLDPAEKKELMAQLQKLS